MINVCMDEMLDLQGLKFGNLFAKLDIDQPMNYVQSYLSKLNRTTFSTNCKMMIFVLNHLLGDEKDSSEVVDEIVDVLQNIYKK